MVSTRNHPKSFPPPTSSPARTSNRQAEATPGWTHTPSNLSLLWISIAVPLVIWDTAYIFLRPYSLPGGSLHDPIWTLYDIYAKVDHTYGWPAYKAKAGFPAAQSMLNAIESVFYLVYLFIVYTYGRSSKAQGRGAPSKSWIGWFGQTRAVSGDWAASAPLICLVAAVSTTSKTILYMFNEYFSGFHSIGHNNIFDVILVFYILNGLWILFPTYLAHMCWSEITQGLKYANRTTRQAADVSDIALKEE